MIIVLKSGAAEADVADVERRIRTMGYTPHTIHGELRNVIGAIGDDRGKERLRALESLECVESVTPILQHSSGQPRGQATGHAGDGGRRRGGRP
jgi:3-deoxy-7-phosphoheptulonate synthase